MSTEKKAAPKPQNKAKATSNNTAKKAGVKPKTDQEEDEEFNNLLASVKPANHQGGEQTTIDSHFAEPMPYGTPENVSVGNGTNIQFFPFEERARFDGVMCGNGLILYPNTHKRTETYLMYDVEMQEFYFVPKTKGTEPLSKATELCSNVYSIERKDKITLKDGRTYTPYNILRYPVAYQDREALVQITMEAHQHIAIAQDKLNKM